MDGDLTGSVLLHACCGPCASACVPRLREAGRGVALCFSNSNIDTREEFDRRLGAARRLAEAEGVELFVDEYDHASWLREVAAGLEDEPERGRRCERCYAYSLRRTALLASERGFGAFSTSLTVSPHKPSAKVFAASADGRFLREDFKKRGGFRLSVRRSAELGLYRQSYCGCEFSRRRPAAAAGGSVRNRAAGEGREGAMDGKLHLVGRLEDSGRFEPLNPLFGKAFEFLRRPDLASLAPGRHEIDGDRCWANVMDADLKPEGAMRLEAHRRYIDIQAPVTGPERIGLARMDAAALALPFDETGDFVLYDGAFETVTLSPGEFAVFFPPLGAHAPCGRVPGGPERIRKVVVKVLAGGAGPESGI